MARTITKFGSAILRDAIAKQSEKARAAGLEIGEAAGANCDWHDNFAFEDARRRHEMESVRLSQLASDLAAAELVDVHEQRTVVAIGTTVELSVGDDVKTLTIGGYGEASAGTGLVSYDSPIARAVMGLRVGETSEAQIGPRLVNIEIKEIRPPSYRYNTVMAELMKSLGLKAT